MPTLHHPSVPLLFRTRSGSVPVPSCFRMVAFLQTVHGALAPGRQADPPQRPLPTTHSTTWRLPLSPTLLLTTRHPAPSAPGNLVSTTSSSSTRTIQLPSSSSSNSHWQPVATFPWRLFPSQHNSKTRPARTISRRPPTRRVDLAVILQPLFGTKQERSWEEAKAAIVYIPFCFTKAFTLAGRPWMTRSQSVTCEEESALYGSLIV